MISIIIPTYEEAESIALIVGKIDSVLTQKSLAYEIIVVDDSSPDSTASICRKLSETFPIRLLVRKGVRGLASAVLDGFSVARGEILLVMDADLSHPPSMIPTMADALMSGGTDFVLGSRYAKGGHIDKKWPLSRQLNSWAAIIFASPIVKLKDPMSGFFALRKKDLPDLGLLNPIGYKIALEIIVKGDYHRVIELPFYFSERRFGKSKLGFKEQLLYGVHVARLYYFIYPKTVVFIFLALFGVWGMLINLKS